jgi:type IV pilus assembly protein PilB
MARVRIGDLLVAAKLITPAQLQLALEYQQRWGGRVGDALVSVGVLDEMALWQGLSHQLGVKLVNLATMNLASELAKALPLRLCEDHALVPIGRDGRGLRVATSDPGNLQGVDAVAFHVGARVDITLAPMREVEWAISKLYRHEQGPCPPPRTRVREDPSHAWRARVLRALVDAGLQRHWFTADDLRSRWNQQSP